MTLLSQEVAQHIDSLVPTRPAELAEMEAHAAATEFPIIGPAAGQFCYVMARAAGAKRVFEMGSGFGYSTAWFARAVQENGGGEVHHVVWDEALSAQARRWLAMLGYQATVKYHVGEAIETLRGSEGDYDVVFNDIDKQDYPASLPVITEKLRSGGLMIVDNILWSGRIFDPDDHSPATEGVRELTREVTADPRWSVTVAPIRDGLLVARKR